jgi:microcystin-dependent protein
MKNPKMMVQVAAVLALVTASVLADVPDTRMQVTPGIINYQGRLLTPQGGVYMDGVYSIEFRLYASSTGSGSGLWSRVYPVYVKDGYFNVMLGAQGSSASAVIPSYREENELWKALWYDSNNSSQSNDRYLGLKVSSVPAGAPAVPAEEAFPRQRLLSAPFSERAQMAQYARAAYDTFTVGTTLTANGLIMAVGGLTASGITTLTNTIINGTTTLNKGLTVNTAEALFNKGITVTGSTAFVKSGMDVAGVATFRGGLNAVNSKVQEEGNSLIPSGVIVMWHGVTPPAGWALCNGANGTPDLRGKFVVGYNPSVSDYNTTGKTGGEATHTLSVAEMPSHIHPYNDRDGTDNGGSNVAGNDQEADGDGTVRIDHTRTTSPQGSDQAHENRPPYFVLAYIMKL